MWEEHSLSISIILTSWEKLSRVSFLFWKYSLEFHFHKLIQCGLREWSHVVNIIKNLDDDFHIRDVKEFSIWPLNSRVQSYKCYVYRRISFSSFYNCSLHVSRRRYHRESISRVEYVLMNDIIKINVPCNFFQDNLQHYWSMILLCELGFHSQVCLNLAKAKINSSSPEGKSLG